ncbi:16S rRNA (uracil(1498)-N(3))-methyltransferase [Kordiimonas laminariae]|uniref:16S rRNA (uracil(1498)-N(3))-methyltransferase n=1 Tax=Kordiimonas laminariae TaxID=2917717 RepID=UPI001FF3973F|nr:16S rRNA (uracil(1498)-N(3))-methyltransferase [Kordiimonas laminariae]MCK0068852.1 16S rRNA (uracil(1498)-N(3))-methyltransferase [Kordiimonas laminariae]
MRNKIDIRLFIETSLPGDGFITLEQDQSHYLANVMRLKAGAGLALFNGKDGEWAAEISDVKKRAVTVRITERVKEQIEEPDVWLVFAPIKKARIDFIAQKATELGAGHLHPVYTRRTIVDRVKTERLHANAVEAAEQCERLTVPTVAEPEKLDKLLDNWPEDRRIMFCDEDLSGRSAHQALAAQSNTTNEPWAIIIGPEGGFDENERNRIKSMPQTTVVSLGPRVLRADTAAMAALTLWQSALGDW